MCVGPCRIRLWAVQTGPAVPPRSIAMEMESARARFPLLSVQKIPFVQIPPTCITLLDALVWLNFGVAEVPLVVCANVVHHGDSSASLGVSSGESSQMRSTRPAEPAAIQGK